MAISKTGRFQGRNRPVFFVFFVNSYGFFEKCVFIFDKVCFLSVFLRVFVRFFLIFLEKLEMNVEGSGVKPA